jgi:orotate phosphoribosyltransferase-like protein
MIAPLVSSSSSYKKSLKIKLGQSEAVKKEVGQKTIDNQILQYEPTKHRVELVRSGRLSTSFSTSGRCRVTLVDYTVVSHDRSVTKTQQMEHVCGLL